MARVFISHSSKDVQLAGLLVDLLRSALDLPADAILCTSVEGHRLAGGADVDRSLRDEIRECEAFLGLISEASIESAYVLFELGARWGLEQHLLPLLAPNADPGLLRGPLRDINPLGCSSGADLHQMVDELGNLLKVKPEKPAAYQRRIDEIVRLVARWKTAATASAGPTEEVRAIFADRFEGFSEWQQYGEGRVSQSEEVAPFSGNFCLKKDSASDPNGGFRGLGSHVNLGLSFSGWIYSPESRAGGRADRLALENSSFDGYGFTVDHSSNRVWIERRENGSARPIGQMVSFTPPSDQWYGFKFYVKSGGVLQLMLHSRSGAELLRTPEVVDDNYTSFDRVVVHGGYPYYVDDLRIDALEA